MQTNTKIQVTALDILKLGIIRQVFLLQITIKSIIILKISRFLISNHLA